MEIMQCFDSDVWSNLWNWDPSMKKCWFEDIWPITMIFWIKKD
jgi:hypothetical protein